MTRVVEHLLLPSLKGASHRGDHQVLGIRAVTAEPEGRAIQIRQQTEEILAPLAIGRRAPEATRRRGTKAPRVPSGKCDCPEGGGLGRAAAVPVLEGPVQGLTHLPTDASVWLHQ
jgi:hypothetical protein